MYRLFPVTITPDGKKLPLLRGWKEEATTDQVKINEWRQSFGQSFMFFGIPTGQESGIIAIDIDVKTANGFESAKQKGLYLPPTMTQRTLSGGWHLIYKAPKNVKIRNTVSKYADGLDTRGDGGYIVYYGFDNTPIADAPEWLVLAESQVPTETVGANFTIKPSMAREMLKDYCDDIINAAAGNANVTMNLKAFEAAQNLIGTGSLSKEEVYDALIKAGQARGKSLSECKATIESGITGGLKQPPNYSCPFEPTPVKNMSAIHLGKWLPPEPTIDMFDNEKALRRPQLFKDWLTEDIALLTADGGTGKTTLKTQEAICLALGQRFLGFENVQTGSTLFITGEDTDEKIYALIGKQMKQMQLNPEQMDIVRKKVRVVKDIDMCFVTKTRDGFLMPNHNALNTIAEAALEIKAKSIIVDPIASFWGSEAALNDMSKAVAKFAGLLRDRTKSAVTLINHMGKESSKTKDLSQFAGRGGSALPSHSRIVVTAGRVDKNDYVEMTGKSLQENQSAVQLYCSKFTDGSPILDEPFIALRTGYLFEKVDIVKTESDKEEKREDALIIIDFLKECKNDNNLLPTKDVVIGSMSGKLSKERVNNALQVLQYKGFNDCRIKYVPNPDITNKKDAIVLIDNAGNEI